MVLGVVAGLKNEELVMAGVVRGDCRDKMADTNIAYLTSLHANCHVGLGSVDAVQRGRRAFLEINS